ncbi:glycosyltransferase family 2 protein [Paenibacillus gorillae]|uniref:glycosyltransferase family 2 protein n=1 Tax=Paenibacillus gorillae TaxID=1243662 RepID=UPI0012DE20A5|nr:glycosyltransferase [Paenibacillus gorillae]
MNRVRTRRNRRKPSSVRTTRRKTAGKRKRGKTAKPVTHSQAAWRLGRSAAESGLIQQNEEEQLALQRHWAASLRQSGKGAAADNYSSRMKSFLAGYFSVSGRAAPNWLLLPTEKTVGAVVMAMNEEQSLKAAIEELERLPLQEIVIIVNGSTDNTLHNARNSGRAIVLHYTSPLGHDVGRAIGAKVSVSEVMLFVDADIPIDAEKLLSFIRRIDGGLDVALNDLSPFIGLFEGRDEVTMLKEFLNRSIQREDLSINSLTAVPHAMSRHAIETIGPANLAVPPKAQAIALKSGLRVGVGGSVDVITRNRVRNSNTGAGNEMIQLIVGDHMEALGWAMGSSEPRLTYADNVRMRGSN